MTINIDKNENSAVLAVAGRLDTVTSPELDAVISNGLDGVTDLTLDLKELEYISSAGLRVMLRAQKKMNLCGSMKLINVSDMVREIFDITGFSDILTVE